MLQFIIATLNDFNIEFLASRGYYRIPFFGENKEAVPSILKHLNSHAIRSAAVHGFQTIAINRN
jgi:hypothetical protein